MSALTDHVRHNRELWDRQAVEYEEPGRRAWALDESWWGIWHVPESTLKVLPDVSGLDVFDSSPAAISEYGACLWCDPYRWIPEAARLLRPGGRLIFLSNSTLVMLCSPDTETEGPAQERLQRDHFGMHRFEWPDGVGIEFHLSHGDWIRLLRSCGFEVEDLIEVRPPESAATRYPWVTLDWARRWPAEEVWKARKG